MDGDTVDRTFGGPSDVDDVPGAPAADDQPRRTGFDRRGTPTRVVLVRHGVTDFTAQGRLDGRGGPTPGSTPPAGPRPSPPGGPSPASCRATPPAS